MTHPCHYALHDDHYGWGGQELNNRSSFPSPPPFFWFDHGAPKSSPQVAFESHRVDNWTACSCVWLGAKRFTPHLQPRPRASAAQITPCDPW